MIRMRMTPEVIARSLAVGVFWGSSATVGFQFIGIGLAWALAHSLKRPFSIAIAVILTNITNPFTITPAYSLFILTGCAIAPECMGGAALVNDLVTRLQTDGIFAAVQNSGYLLVLAFLGSLLYAVPATVGAYLLGLFIGRRLEARRRKKARNRIDEIGTNGPPSGGGIEGKPRLVVKALRDKLS